MVGMAVVQSLMFCHFFSRTQWRDSVALFPANCWSQCLQVQVKSPLAFVTCSIISHSQILFNEGSKARASMVASSLSEMATEASILLPVLLLRQFVANAAGKGLARLVGWRGGRGGRPEQSVMLVAIQGCDNSKIMVVAGCSVHFDDDVLHWLKWLVWCRFLHLHLWKAVCVFSL